MSRPDSVSWPVGEVTNGKNGEPDGLKDMATRKMERNL